MGNSGHSWESLRNRIISKGKYYSILEDIKNVPGYATIDGVEEISQKHDVHENIVKSIRSNYLQTKIKINLPKVSRKIEEIYGKYKLGVSIEELCREYNFPAISLLRLFLKKQGFDKPTINELWKETPDSGEIWNRISNDMLRKDWQVCLYSEDIASKKVSGNKESVASIVEGKICAKVDKLGISYKTEEQLKKEEAPATPDLLFTDEGLKVGNEEITWIEVKSFFGFPQSPYRGILKQVERNNTLFGTGLLIHKAGIVDSLVWKYKKLCVVMTGEQFDYFTDNYKT